MITIQGLTERQRAIAELLWTCNSQEDLDTLVRALPKASRADAESLITVILQESLEEDGHLDRYLESAQEVIDRVR